jgi:hypothetical protein
VENFERNINERLREQENEKTARERMKAAMREVERRRQEKFSVDLSRTQTVFKRVFLH